MVSASAEENSEQELIFLINVCKILNRVPEHIVGKDHTTLFTVVSPSVLAKVHCEFCLSRIAGLCPSCLHSTYLYSPCISMAYIILLHFLSYLFCFLAISSAPLNSCWIPPQRWLMLFLSSMGQIQPDCCKEDKMHGIGWLCPGRIEVWPSLLGDVNGAFTVALSLGFCQMIGEGWNGLNFHWRLWFPLECQADMLNACGKSPVEFNGGEINRVL